MQVAKWGNSLAVRLPKKLVDEMGLKPGDEIALVDAGKDRLGVEKIDRRAEALHRLQARGWEAPADYKFDRDEANER